MEQLKKKEKKEGKKKVEQLLYDLLAVSWVIDMWMNLKQEIVEEKLG